MILNSKSLNKHQIAFAKHIGIELGTNGKNVIFSLGDSIDIDIQVDTVYIKYSTLSESFRALAILKEDLKLGTHISQPRSFENLAAFYDCSRNAVLTTDSIKTFIMDIAALGFNQLYLYTEDTFEIPEYPYFGYQRGRYSADEIKECDAFAKLYGIELIPAIQTLAHLNTIFHWKCFNDIGHAGTLNCGDEKVYDFLDKLFASVRSMYTTDKINIGMDEAHNLGKDSMGVFLSHINRVVKIAEKYNFKPIMWSDMFFKLAVGELNFEDLKAAEFDRKVLDLIPDNVTLAYWNYSKRTQEYYDTMIESHLAMGKKMMFVGGFRKWAGFCPSTSFSFDATRTALTSCVKYKVKDVIVTGWGDGGAEASLYAMLPGLVLYSEQCFCRDMSDETVEKKMKLLFGTTINDYLVLEKPNRLPDLENVESSLIANDNKTVLWNDPILGIYDKHILSGTDAHFASTAKELKKIVDSGGRFSYVFETVYYLCDFLSMKAEIGNRMRSAYKSGDKETLKSIANDIPLMVEKLDKFQSIFRKNWLKENKIFGFQVQDIRFGALHSRLLYTSEILNAYLNGKVTEIIELETEPLYMDCRSSDSETSLHYMVPNWMTVSTVNPL